MKKCACGFETKNSEFKLCPMCGRELEVDNGKRFYTMGLSAEEDHFAEIEMTHEEAEIVSRVLKELHENKPGYCGSCWIDFD
ncbi:MAG: hypothetical protein LLF98_02380 [Clostridium sp.]|uniref:hypothetical protein n=1 Tax=Clostridium sp. TaxID=1506 RepID=UPI0025BE2A0E|nr:hypothetical protein [Clostridium sp.]MCE5220129.1 hypothetical protein [Clostridium sp.]